MSKRLTRYLGIMLLLSGIGRLSAWAQLNLPLGDLPAGEAVTIIFEVTLDSVQTNSSVANQAIITSGNVPEVLSDDPDTGTPLDPTLTLVEAFADVGVEVIPAANPVDASSLVVLDLVVSNAGPNDTTGVVVSNQLPAGVTFDALNSSANLVELGGGLLKVVIGDFAAGQVTNYTIQLAIDDCCQAGFLTNSANVVHLVTDVNALNDTHTLAVAVLPDTDPPVITFCPPAEFLGCNPDPGDIPVIAPASVLATDTCGPVTNLFVSDILSTNGCQVTLTRTYAVVDRCNNSNTCVQSITWIEDLEGPVFTQCVPDEDLGCNPLMIPAADTNVLSVADACGGVSLSLFSELTVTNGCDVTLSRVYLALDDCGNASTCTQRVIWIEDLAPPTINGCPPGQDLGCNPISLPAPVPGLLGAVDNCGVVAITNVDVVVTNGCDFILTRTYIITDPCGNSTTCSHVFTWTEDNEAPQITTCAPDMDLGCNPTNIPPGDVGAVTATDNCGIAALVIADETTVTNGCDLTRTRTYLVLDGCGNSNTCVQTLVWTVDTESPVITQCAPDADLGCNPAVITPADTNAVMATDNCGIASIGVLSEVLVTNMCQVTLTRTYTVQDACGNSSNCVQTLTWIEDTENPVITACAPSQDLGCNPTNIPSADTNAVVATDNCGSVTVTLLLEVFSQNGCDLTINRTYLVADPCGNTNSCLQTITWTQDLDAPEIFDCAPDMDLGCNPTSIPPADTNAINAVDFCGIASITVSSEVTTTNGCDVTLRRTYRLSDACGNVSTCVQTLTWVEDLVAPVITFCPAGGDLGCNATVIPPADTNAVLATDACGGVSISVASESTVTNGCLVSFIRTYQVIDDCGNTSTCDQVFFWTGDLEPPTIVTCAPDIDLGCNPVLIPGGDTNLVNATDNCGVSSIAIVGESVVTNGCTVTLNRTYVVFDGCGNSNTCVQVLSWTEDLEPPVITACPPDEDLGCNPVIPAPDVSLVMTTDNCGMVTVVHQGDVAVTNGCIVTLTRTYGAFDACSPAVTCSQVLTYTHDLSGPVFASATNSVTLIPDENCRAVIPDVLAGVVVNDACGSVSLAQSPLPGAPVQGPTPPPIVISATDDCGNISTTNVVVLIDCPGGVTIAKSVYLGQDAGASCPGVSLIMGTNNTPITFCFVVENTGTVHLANLVVEDTMLPGFTPLVIPSLLVGASTSVYFETVIAGSLTNIASVVGVPAYSLGPSPLTGVRSRPSGAAPVSGVSATGSAVVIALGQISDTVWLDVNRDGQPNENIASLGLSNITVNLYRVDLLGTQTFITNSVTQAVPGNGGFYVFSNLLVGTYAVEVDVSTLPTGFQFPTTPTSQVFNLASGQVLSSVDFGFISVPTEIALASFDAHPTDSGIRVNWRTGSERNNLGFYVYRSDQIDGERTRLPGDLIAGKGTGAGAQYSLLDVITEPGTYYYWLEDYDYSLNTKLHGPAVARLTLEPVVLEVGSAGIYRASAGIVKINGQPVPVISTEDGVIYYLPDATAEVTLSAGQPEVMEGVDASPIAAEALQLVEAENGTARFTTEEGVVVYLVFGFEAPPIIVLDISDPWAPKAVSGAILEGDDEAGVYLSYPEGADLIAEAVE